MKKDVLCCLITGGLLFVSCTLLHQHRSQEGTSQTSAKPILTGWLTQQQVFDQIQQYQLGKDQYQPQRESLEKLKSSTTDVQIIVFLGTWCSDSQREVPRFLKIMELVQNPHISYRLFGLDRSKRDSAGLAEKHQIEFVPTFVVIHNDEEAGRIVETPIASIEQDLAEIVTPLR